MPCISTEFVCSTDRDAGGEQARGNVPRMEIAANSALTTSVQLLFLVKARTRDVKATKIQTSVEGDNHVEDDTDIIVA